MQGVCLHVCALHLDTLRQLHYVGGILTCMCLASKYPEAVALCRGILTCMCLVGP